VLNQMNREEAEMLAVSALQYLAGDEELLIRFISLSGVDPGEIRQLAGSPAFQAGVLDHLLSDEPVLMAFAAERGIDPARVASARQTLEPQDHQTSV